MDRTALLQKAQKLKWFHAIDFGDHQSSGRFPAGVKQNITLYPVMALLQDVDLTGQVCLDVGTANGLSAFGMKIKGAQRVVGTDVGEVGPPFALARELLGLDVEYVGNTSFDNIMSKMPEHEFDVMVCAGIMYHMLNPFDCILKARRLLKNGGLLVLETAYHSADKTASIDFNATSGRLKEVFTYWMPSESAVLGMLNFAGFETMAVRMIHKPDRIAVLARNVQLHKLSNRPEMLVRLHDAGVYDPCFKSVLPDEPVSNAPYAGAGGRVLLDWQTFEPAFPPHPSLARPSLGSTTWRSTTRNF